MCICDNCKWLERCKTYYDLEKNYEVEPLTSHPDVNAYNPLIHTCLFEGKNGIFQLNGMLDLVLVFIKKLAGGQK